MTRPAVSAFQNPALHSTQSFLLPANSGQCPALYEPQNTPLGGSKRRCYWPSSLSRRTCRTRAVENTSHRASTRQLVRGLALEASPAVSKVIHPSSKLRMDVTEHIMETGQTIRRIICSRIIGTLVESPKCNLVRQHLSMSPPRKSHWPRSFKSTRSRSQRNSHQKTNC